MRAWGLYYTKQSIFDKINYLTMKILPNQNGKNYDDYYNEIKLLKENHKNIQGLINYYEEKFNLTEFTNIEAVNDDYYLISLPNFWTDATYRISLYTLLLRCGLWYDGNKTPEEYFKEFNIGKENDLIRPALKKLELMINGKIPKQDLTKLNIMNVHNFGIISFNEWKT